RLQGEANTLASANLYAVQQVAVEAVHRAADVAGVQSQVGAEAAGRQQADANLQNQINGPDPSSLQNQINAEEGLRQSSDAGLQTQLDTNNMTTDQAIKALTQRLNELIGQTAPVGTVMAFAGPFNKIPAGWELCDGRLLTRDASTQALFDVIGTTWGSNDNGAATFRLPDLRGRFLRGLDASPNTGVSGRDQYRSSRFADYLGGNGGNSV